MTWPWQIPKSRFVDLIAVIWARILMNIESSSFHVMPVKPEISRNRRASEDCLQKQCYKIRCQICVKDNHQELVSQWPLILVSCCNLDNRVIVGQVLRNITVTCCLRRHWVKDKLIQGIFFRTELTKRQNYIPKVLDSNFEDKYVMNQYRLSTSHCSFAASERFTLHELQLDTAPQSVSS